MNGAFCVPCLYFGRRVGLSSLKIPNLMAIHLGNWNSPLRKLDNHKLNQILIQTSMLTMQSFVAVMNNEIKSINQMQE